MKTLAISLACLGALALAGCTTVPTQLEGDFPDISPARVDASVFGQTVRWGGIIIDAKNEPNRTCFEVLSRELGTYLRPNVEDRTAGRFIACKDGFYDPEVFSKGREVTLTGRIDRVEDRQIEEFNYRYPVIEVDELVLWEERQDVLVHRDYYYDPFWYPYYWGRPYWGYYPYYRHPFGYWGHTTIRQTLPGPARLEPENDN
jgi:outer membrane lipoprotein